MMLSSTDLALNLRLSYGTWGRLGQTDFGAQSRQWPVVGEVKRSNGSTGSPAVQSRLFQPSGRNAYPLGPLGLAVLSLEVVLHIANLLTMDHEPRRERESLNPKA